MGGQPAVAMAMPQAVTVRISVQGGQVQVHPYEAVICKGQNEEIVWQCDAGNFTVEFKNTSPFNHREFRQQSTQPAHSRQISRCGTR